MSKLDFQSTMARILLPINRHVAMILSLESCSFIMHKQNEAIKGKAIFHAMT